MGKYQDQYSGVCAQAEEFKAQMREVINRASDLFGSTQLDRERAVWTADDIINDLAFDKIRQVESLADHECAVENNSDRSWHHRRVL